MLLPSGIYWPAVERVSIRWALWNYAVGFCATFGVAISAMYW